MLETTALQLFCRCFSSDRSHGTGSAQDIADGGQRSKSCELDGCFITRGYLRFSSTPHTPEPVPDDGAAAVSATMARRRTHRLFMAERLLKLLQDERKRRAGQGCELRDDPRHAVSGTITSRGYSRARESRTRACAELYPPRTHSRNPHTLPGRSPQRVTDGARRH